MTTRPVTAWAYALAGLETGITGALAMLAWFALGSVWSRHSIWWFANLVAAVSFGEAAIRNSPGLYTWVGAAFLLFFYGLAGTLFGLLLRQTPFSLRVFLFALIVSLGIDWALLRWFWKEANPVAHLYASDTQILIAHLLFGCFLARYPGGLRRIARMPAGTLAGR